jgi:hypothetical protein
MKKKMILKCAVLMLATLSLVLSSIVFVSADAADLETARLEFLAGDKFTITNGDGEKLQNDGKKFSGNMEILSISATVGTTAYILLTVKDSNKFSYKGHRMPGYFSVESSDIGADVTATNYDLITISKGNDEATINITGKNIKYNIGIFADNNSDCGVDIEGSAEKEITVTDRKTGIEITGATSPVKFTSDDLEDNANSVKSVELAALSDTFTVGNLTGAFRINGAIKLGAKTYKKIVGVHVLKADGGKKMLVYWAKVKKADGYIVYRYDKKARKYKKAKTLYGIDNRAWADSGVKEGSTYKYKAVSFKLQKKGGKSIKKLGKRSYAVSAVTTHGTLDNAESISINKQALNGKVGTKARLKATVAAAAGKKLVSGSVRWFSSDKKVATVDAKGNVNFKKKGKCYIRAKAHNGLNSARVQVVAR